MSPRSTVDEFQRLPSAILTDGLLPVPLFVVTRMSLSETYSLPPVGSSGFRAAVDNSDDSVQMSALLIGPQRFAWKQSLELLADFSRRGGALARWTGGGVGGLIPVTSMTVRLDMHVTELSFAASATRRDTLEVNIGLRHVPQPGPLNVLIDLGAAAAMSLTDALT
ncbi:hypothetical protein [Ilumatobacter sp.]|uniref:hypothetical protein n=1 Tax=Ilumatobacter sp. TaxID=1967498 RepID=UPI003B51AD4F